jgi:putative ABC transport system permease protein
MFLANVFREFWSDLKQQRLRTTLTILGITWGTVAVVVLLAFGQGLEEQTVKRFHGLGDRIVILFGGRTTKTFAGFPDGRYISLREEDGVLLQREVPEISQLSPEYSRRGVRVRRGVQSAQPNITGILPVYGEMRNVIAAQGGRFINELDQAQRRRVVFLGNEVADLLFEGDDPVGGIVYVGETPFTVVGVMAPKIQNSSYNGQDQDRVFIPASTHVSLFGGTHVNNFVYRTTDAFLTKAVEARVRGARRQVPLRSDGRRRAVGLGHRRVREDVRLPVLRLPHLLHAGRQLHADRGWRWGRQHHVHRGEGADP